VSLAFVPIGVCPTTAPLRGVGERGYIPRATLGDSPGNALP